MTILIPQPFKPQGNAPPTPETHWIGGRKDPRACLYAVMNIKMLKLHNEELLDLYSSLSIIRTIKARRMRWAGHVARMGEKSNAYRLLVGKPEGRRPLGRPRRRWVDNIRIYLVEVGRGDVDWINLAQYRYRWRALVNSTLNFRVP
jgi:hypothetical protein